MFKDVWHCRLAYVGICQDGALCGVNFVSEKAENRQLDTATNDWKQLKNKNM